MEMVRLSSCAESTLVFRPGLAEECMHDCRNSHDESRLVMDTACRSLYCGCHCARSFHEDCRQSWSESAVV